MATCKAAVFVGADEPLEVQEFPIPDLDPGAVLVKMDMAAVCATDVHNHHNPTWPRPMIFGHENIGTIDRLGKGVDRDVLGHPLKEGDRVIFRATPCGRCFNCSIGENCQVVKNYGFIPADQQTENLRELAVRQNAWALQYIPPDQRTKNIEELAVQRDREAIALVPPDKRTTRLMAIAGGQSVTPPPRMPRVAAVEASAKPSSLALR
mgnify:CR=1 FL=1